MKKYLIIVLLLLSATAYGFGGLMMGSGTGVTSAVSYLLEEKYEGVGIPSGHSYIDSSGTNKVDWDDTTPTMEGSESAYYPDPGGSGQNKVNIEPGSDADEMWASAMFQWVNIPSAAQTSRFFRLSDTASADVARIGIGDSGDVEVDTNLGGSKSSVVCTVSTGTTYYIKIRAKKGTGSNAEVEVWCTTGTGSWGTSQTSTNGTWTTQLDFVEINNYWTHNVNYNMDHLIIDDSDIPISAY